MGKKEAVAHCEKKNKKKTIQFSSKCTAANFLHT